MLTRRHLVACAAALPVAALPLSAAGFAQPFAQAAFDAAVAAGRPVLVEVSASWCPTCAQQKAILSELLARPGLADFTVFEVDFDTRKDLLRAFNARRQSTLIVFGKGAEVGRSVGDTDPVGIEALLRKAL